ncbi:hypothetical protein K2Z84_31110 [Candidatus Binatia bacterium]|nr:hypothetical protein [Candidatus Binatia bacterium]
MIIRKRLPTTLSPARAWSTALLLGLAGSLWLGVSAATAVSSEESLQRCQEKAMKQTQQYEAAATKALDSCLKAANQDLLVRRLGLPAAATAQKCAVQMQAVDDSRQRGSSAAEKMAAKIMAACDPSANPKLTHTLDDVTGKGAPSVESPLNAKKIEAFCAQHTLKQTIDTVADWIRCQRGAAEAAASSKMAAKFPDAPSVMEKMKNAIADLPPNPKNPQVNDDAAANIDKLRRIIDANHDEQADLLCSQPDNS